MLPTLTPASLVTTEAVSIVLCTYNGAPRIDPTLRALRALATSRLPLLDRIIVVDNASVDRTG